ncbi:MAG: LptF/LptG family permease [Treponema sp.]|nr:LptF/LptG family permease [Treponema sp.]
MVHSRSISWTLFRYVVTEALLSFFVSFLFFFFIFFVNQLLLLAQDILTKQVPFGQVALLVFYALPQVVALAAPFASMVGILMTVGRMSSDNEILVMLSSGLSYRALYVPAIVVGILISVFSFLTNDILLPAGTIQFNKLYRLIAISTPALELEANSVKRFKDTIIVTGEVEGNSIGSVLILDRTGDGERRVILAKNAELKDWGGEGLSLDLEAAFIQSSKEMARSDYDYASSSFLRYWVPHDDIIQTVSSITPKEMSSTDVLAEIREKQFNLNHLLEERLGWINLRILEAETTLRQGPNHERWNRRNSLLADIQREIQEYRSMKRDRTLFYYLLEYYKKFSIPLGAFSFVFLSVALGLMAKKSGQTVGFILGLIIAVLYWALILGGQTVGLRLGFSPFWSMWTPNILAITAGIIFSAVRIRK